LTVEVRSGAPRWIFPPEVNYEPLSFDVGVIQPDALRVDARATLEQAAALAVASGSLVCGEAAFLRQVGARLVVVDVPAVPILAARAAGLPSVAISNFSWDWIYAPYIAAAPRFRWLGEWLRDVYGQADLLLRLPFFGDLSAFLAVEDLPLVSRPPSRSRAAVRADLGITERTIAALLSFGGLGLERFDPAPLAELQRYTFVASPQEISPGLPLPPNVRLLPTEQENFVNLIAASDVVISKPGFGIVANCLTLQVPLLYTEREDFVEFEVLVEGLERYGRARLIPRAELLAARLGPHLEALLADSRPWPALRTDGAEVAADRLLSLV
jgi:L-arabinokinase